MRSIKRQQMIRKTPILYISYDGLLDPLGESQIIPYLIGIAQDNEVIILSFEKKKRLAKGRALLKKRLARSNITWIPLNFTPSGNLVAKIWDLTKMYTVALFLATKHRVRIVHSRGHTAAKVGYFIKKLTGAKFLFDFRGLWVDERVDKGGWDLKYRSHLWQYNYLKVVERRLLAGADHVVVLTKAVVSEIGRLGANLNNVTVIPCCADFDHFQLATPREKYRIRANLGIRKHAPVIGYLGSVGSMYMINRIFRLFEILADSRPGMTLLIVTQDPAALEENMRNSLKPGLHSRVVVKSLTRSEVPKVIPAMDALISFIKPSYARIAASPTKLAECFSAGIPVICNPGVGDVECQVRMLDAGRIVDPDADAELQQITECFDEIIKMGGSRLREAARPILGLELANRRYKQIYEMLK